MEGILGFFNSTLWAMEPTAYNNMIEIYRSHMYGNPINVAALEAKMGGPLPGSVQGYEVVDGVAIVPIDGILAKRMNMLMKVSGGTSLELLGRDFAQALADPTVKSILLQVDSPGGSVMGLQEVADVIYAARGKKPIVALTDGMMASAAYWLASAADALYITSDTTLVGSIGVVYRHIDRSGADAQAGLKVSEIHAGKYKTMASDAAPLSDTAKADIQAKVDAIYRLFVDTIARNRGVNTKTVLETQAEGRVFLGRSAVNAGLVDGVSTMGALLANLKAGTLTGLQARATPSASAAISAGGPTQPRPTVRNNRMDTTTQKLSPEDVEAQARSDWAADSSIREEFLVIENYVAYAKAVAAGRARIMGRAA